MTDDDALRETVAAYQECGCNAAETARQMGVPASTVKDRLYRAAQLGLDGSVPKPMPPGQIVKGTSTLFRLDPETGAEEVMQWVRTKEDPNFTRLHDAIREAFEEYAGRSAVVPPPVASDADLLALYPLADYHLGLYAWGEETGGDDWDVDKACDLLRSVMAELVAETPPAETAVILNLGDFFHADTQENRTMRSGHALDVDTRYAKVLSLGVSLMVECVELALQRHQRVILRNLRGNHDDHSSVALTAAMGAWFRNQPRVTVDASPSAHWAYEFGRVLLGATHGDTLKKPEHMAMLLAADAEAWGRTRYRYFHFGHLHHASAKECGSVLVEGHRTLAPKDAWAAAAGYQSGRSMSSITYHRDRGEQSRRTVNIPHYRDV